MLQYFQMENPSIKLNAETKQLYYTCMYTIHQKPYTQYTIYIAKITTSERNVLVLLMMGYCVVNLC